MIRTVAALLAMLAITVQVHGEAAKPATPCSTSEYDQFDFWLGKWTAYDAAGTAQGTNHLLQVMGNCALQENWVGAGGRYQGTSYNFYDAQSKKWHQTWVDNSGGHLLLSGGMDGDSMQLSGRRDDDGTPVIDRITWTPLKDGRVRQHWEVSKDDGKTWTDVFDGYYQRDTKAAD